MLLITPNRFFSDSFSVLHDSQLVENVIPRLVTESMNRLLSILPSEAEIKAVVFTLNKDSAPTPDGFGVSFFHNFWDTIKVDVISVVLQLFNSSWILPGYNSNAIILIPKSQNANSLDQFRPISLANFKFKIISKILSDKLAPLMPTRISPEQSTLI